MLIAILKCFFLDERKQVMQSIIDACDELESLGLRPSKIGSSTPSALDLFLQTAEDDDT